MDKNSISVIVSTYNRADFIKESVESILSQTFPVFEILIVDDGSSDNTKEIVMSIADERIKYIWQKNQGIPAVTRNIGLKKAKGKYIAFLDSDDIWLPKKLEKQMKIFERNPNILLVSTNGYIFHTGDKRSKWILNLFFDKKILFQNLLRDNIIIASSVLMRSDVIQLVGFMDENPQIRASEDYDYWLRILNYKDESIMVIKDRLVMYRVHKSNLSNVQNSAVLPIDERVRIIFDKYREYDQNYLKMCLANYEECRNICTYAIKLYKGEIGVRELVKVSQIGIINKIIILIKYFVFRCFPYLRKFYRTNI